MGCISSVSVCSISLEMYVILSWVFPVYWHELYSSKTCFQYFFATCNLTYGNEPISINFKLTLSVRVVEWCRLVLLLWLVCVARFSIVSVLGVQCFDNSNCSMFLHKLACFCIIWMFQMELLYICKWWCKRLDLFLSWCLWSVRSKCFELVTRCYQNLEVLYFTKQDSSVLDY